MLIAVNSVAFLAGMFGGDRAASAQVVQLPSTQTFGYSGTATVPDMGQAYLGGVSRQASGTATRGGGLLPARAIGSQSSGGSVSVSATIIDLDAMDAAILNQPSAARTTNYRPRSTGRTVMNTLTPHLYARRLGADELARPSGPNAWQIALGGGGASQVGTANAIVGDDSDVRFFMHRAKEASDAGRTSAAVVYYRMAYERLTPQQRTRLQDFQAQAQAQAQASAGAQAGATPGGTAGDSAAATAAPGSIGASAAPGSAAGSAESAEPPEAVDANPFGSPF